MVLIVSGAYYRLLTNVARPVLHKPDNVELAAIFHRMAAGYRYLGPEQRFRAIAYDSASRTIHALKQDLSFYANDSKSLKALPGIGESIAKKVTEYVKTGKVNTYEQLKKKIPESLLDLMDITGFGPATVRRLHQELGVNNREDLVAAIEKGLLKNKKGFGARKIENLMHGLKLFKAAQERMLLSEALNVGNKILDHVRKIKGILKAEVAGSVRRRKETVGDIDIVASVEKGAWKKIVSELLQSDLVGRVLGKGETKISFLLRGRTTQVDIRLVDQGEFGAALMYFTGSKEHNIKLRTWAREKNWKLNEYGVFDGATDDKLAGRTEEEIYELFDMQFIPPELREADDEIALSKKYKLPKLVQISEIRGDMQMHSRWSDGTEKIEKIAGYVSQTFPHYEYIVITDHSPSERVARGLQVKDFKAQFAEIDRLNHKMGRNFIKKGVEVDILPDGSLDLPQTFLEQFDWVTASIHSGFNRDNTSRLVKACENPLVHCIGHPSGRLIGKREGYPVDWQLLFGKLLMFGTAIEINAQPDRLDLKEDLVKEAVEKGVTLTISTDAHMLNQFDFMELGISVARRGWCTRRNILNTGSWTMIEAFKKNKHRLYKSAKNQSAKEKSLT